MRITACMLLLKEFTYERAEAEWNETKIRIESRTTFSKSN